MESATLRDAKSKLAQLRLEPGKNGLRCKQTIPCGNQLDLWTILLLQDISERLIQVERLVLPESEDISEAREVVNYTEFTPEPEPVPEPVVKTLSPENLKELNDLQAELQTAVDKQSEIQKEEDDDVESVESEGTICTEAAHKVISEKYEQETGSKPSAWIIEDGCSGCAKSKAKKLKAAKKEERRKVKAMKKELRGKLSEELNAEVAEINRRITLVRGE